jgi:hypothetical protein
MVPQIVGLIHTLGHTLEHHVADKALDSKEGEGKLTEIEHALTSGFPYYGLSPILVYGIGVLIVIALIVYSIAGKGQGSHAGREEVRRSYRRQLAREMAKQDAAEIKAGKKPRRRWMQW